MSVLSAWRNTPTLTLSYTQSSCFNDLITGEPDVVKSKSHRCVVTVLIRQHLYSCLYAHSSLHDFFLLNKVTKSKNKKKQTDCKFSTFNKFFFGLLCVFSSRWAYILLCLGFKRFICHPSNSVLFSLRGNTRDQGLEHIQLLPCYKMPQTKHKGSLHWTISQDYGLFYSSTLSSGGCLE